MKAGGIRASVFRTNVGGAPKILIFGSHPISPHSSIPNKKSISSMIRFEIKKFFFLNLKDGRFEKRIGGVLVNLVSGWQILTVPWGEGVLTGAWGGPEGGRLGGLPPDYGFVNVAPDNLVRIRFKLKNASQFLRCIQTICRLPFRGNTFVVDQSFAEVRVPLLPRLGFQCRPLSKQHFFSHCFAQKCIWNNLREDWDSNLGQLGEHRECYLCAVSKEIDQSVPTIDVFINVFTE